MNTVKPKTETVATCGRCDIDYTDETWKDLEQLGVKDYEGLVLDHANCPCGNTLARVLEQPRNHCGMCRSESVSHQIPNPSQAVIPDYYGMYLCGAHARLYPMPKELIKLQKRGER